MAIDPNSERISKNKIDKQEDLIQVYDASDGRDKVIIAGDITTELSSGMLQIEGGVPIDGTLRNVEDQDGNVSPLQLSTDEVGISKSSTATTQDIAVIRSTDTNAGIAIVPNGTGAITAQVPDGTATGGNARGDYAVDLQIAGRNSSSQVASGNYSTISGGARNQASGSFSAVGGGFDNSSNGLQSVISGGVSNTISSNYSTISGGVNNTTSTNTHATVVGGYQNSSTGQYSISGGYSNTASGPRSVAFGNQNTASGLSASVLGGENNTVSSPYSVISGGENNTVNIGYGADKGGVIVGGSNNSVSANYGFIGGGSGNSLGGNDNYQVIVGGRNNSISGSGHAFIGAGELNSIASGGNGFNVIAGGRSNTLSSQWGAISGGQNNTASTGTHATVVGGSGNTSSGQYSVSGGNGSNASGAYSLSLGRLASASGTSSYSFGYQTNANKEYSFALGRRSIAYLRNQISVQSVDTGGQGQTQYSTVIASKDDTLNSAATTVLSLDGTGTSNLIILNGTNRVWNVTIKYSSVVTGITGTATGVNIGDVKCQTLKIGFKKIGGISSVVGTITTVATNEDSSMSGAGLAVTAGTSQEMKLEFTAPTFSGGGSVTVRVVAKVELTEVAY